MSVVAVLNQTSQPTEDYFRAQGWHVAYAPVPGMVAVMARDRLNEASIRDCLTMPWAGGMETAGGGGARPAGLCFKRHLLEGGLGLVLRSDTAYGAEVASLFVAALKERLLDPEAETGDLEFVIHELVSNALLHGNFAIKRLASGGETDLDRFTLHVAEALASPEISSRRLQVSAALTWDRLEIAVEDDGDGFDHTTLTTRPHDPLRPHGLTLVSDMVANLRFEEGGRRAVVELPFHPRRKITAPVDLGKAHVLVVDDNPVNRSVLEALLAAIGVGTIEMAANGIEGLAAIDRKKPDLVMLDVMMPQMNGYEMCRRLRHIHPLTDLPVIFVTALDGPGDRAACFSAGGNDMVSKPIDTKEVIARVGVHLQLGLLLEKMRSYQDRVHEELQAARGAQLALTPTPEHIAAIRARTGLTVEGLVETSSELGGDFWTIFDAGPRQLGLLVADFSGHGAVAAFNVFRLHLLVSRLPRQTPPPGALLTRLNQELKALLKPGEFAAAFAGLIDLDAGTLTYSSAAAPPPIMMVEGRARFLEAEGPPLGAFSDAEYEEWTVPMPPGSSVLAYSDALVESTVDGELVCDDETLLSWVSGVEPGRCLAAAVLGHFHQRLPGEPPDDLTLVCVRRPADPVR
ncbi:Chemotaxis response regulator protein-glutamate methylesterase [Candidatus Terasakiella magnetica]|nr:Chemotaxis response regulator protein-glutamate methylesterase [Candidatus Terasakiella magnetica]